LVLFFFLADIFSHIFTFSTGHPSVYGILPKFQLNVEQSIPTYFSALLLLFSAVLLWIIAVNRKKENNPYARYWKLLSIIFLYLSLDEMVSLHELFNRINIEGNAIGIFYFSWTIVAIPLLVIFLIVFVKFLFHLPLKTRILFIISGILYCIGSLGTEFVGGWFISKYGPDFYEALPYIITVTIEETLEMVGIVVFIYSLLDYLRAYLPEIRLRVGKEEPAP